MSEVKVNKISPRSGTTVTLGDSGDTFTVPSGATFDASNATTTLPSTVVTTTGSQTLTNKTIDASQLTGTITPSDATVTPAKLAYNYNQFRNIIINGDMSIAQRGTSQASAGSGSGLYQTVDRYKFLNNNLGVFTISQDTDVPSGQGFAKSLKLDCTSADASPASGDYLLIQVNTEGQNLQYLKKGTTNAQSLTLSFWVKAVKTGTFIVDLVDVDNNRTISQSYTINSASTWEKKTLTFAGDTTGAFDNDNAKSLECNFWLGAGTDFTSGTLQTSWGTQVTANRVVGQVNLADSTSNDFWITGVQLEAGTTASDFEFLPHDVNLQRCQRYYWQQISSDSSTLRPVAVGSYIQNAYIEWTTQFPVQMRATPSLVSPTVTNGYEIYRAGAADSFNEVLLGNSTQYMAFLYNNTQVSGTGGQAGSIYCPNTYASSIAFSAEL
jgi:hypothetical protein